MNNIPLSSKLGEITAPNVLVIALVVSPNGEVECDAGALHGRSALESRLQMVKDRTLVAGGQPWRIVWAALELDQAQQPRRYLGASVCELLVDEKSGRAYKSLAEHVNRLSEAMRGAVDVDRLSPQQRQAVRQQLIELGEAWWQSAPEPFQAAFGG